MFFNEKWVLLFQTVESIQLSNYICFWTILPFLFYVSICNLINSYTHKGDDSNNSNSNSGNSNSNTNSNNDKNNDNNKISLSRRQSHPQLVKLL